MKEGRIKREGLDWKKLMEDSKGSFWFVLTLWNVDFTNMWVLFCCIKRNNSPSVTTDLYISSSLVPLAKCRGFSLVINFVQLSSCVHVEISLIRDPKYSKKKKSYFMSSSQLPFFTIFTLCMPVVKMNNFYTTMWTLFSACSVILCLTDTCGMILSEYCV